MTDSEFNYLLIKVAVACMAIDGSIDEHEVQVVRQVIVDKQLNAEQDSEGIIQNLLTELKQKGIAYTFSCLSKIRDSAMSHQQLIDLLKWSISIIKADERIVYKEVRFFKLIRKNIGDRLTEEEIFAEIPDIDKIFLLPDVKEDRSGLID